MSRRLQSVLSSVDLPAAELWAARLDGQLFRLGDCFMPIDEVQQPIHRARVVYSAVSVLPGSDSRMIAEQRSAAWIWGALDVAPIRHQFCVGVNSRTGRDLSRIAVVREVVIDAREITMVGDFRVTTALRTVIDIARFSERFDAEEQRTVSILMRESSITLDECIAEMDS